MCGFSPAPAPPGGGLLREWAAFLSPQLDWNWTGFGSWLDRLRGARAHRQRRALRRPRHAPDRGDGVRAAAAHARTRPGTWTPPRRGARRRAPSACRRGSSTRPSVYADTAELIGLAKTLGRRPGRALHLPHPRRGPDARGGDRGSDPDRRRGRGARPGLPPEGLPQGQLAEDGRGPPDDRDRAGPRRRRHRRHVPLHGRVDHPGQPAPRLGARGGHGRAPRPARRRRDAPPDPRRRPGGRRASGTGRTAPVAWSDVMVAECPRVPGVEGRTHGRDRGRPGGPGGGAAHRPPARGGRPSVDDQLPHARRQRRPWPPVPPRDDRLGQPRALRGTRGTPTPGSPTPGSTAASRRSLGTYVRERGVLSWESAVHKMTGLSAARLGLADRGILRPGAFADVVVFDPATVDDLATYQDPHRYPAGFRAVWVNGRSRARGRAVSSAADRPRPRADPLARLKLRRTRSCRGVESSSEPTDVETSFFDLI